MLASTAMTDSNGFPFKSNHVFLEDGGEAIRVADTTAFWREIMGGRYESEVARRIAEGSGWLVAYFGMDKPPGNWEMHPAGDEILLVLEGAMTAILEQGAEEHRIEVSAGSACIVPKGAWHRLIPTAPCKIVAMTFGKGTEHRPVQ